ncbi:hypothetical protein BB560_001296 [Smittium megazygosporum]|uniref:Pre-mRNA-splicing factor SPF27 n=1 Tax=Smittium megazygosporum TaxID=133381 RepID=A0A2T9ZI04_9FUNG|nr:hypothetical protein BB560_001296 [Smittium megazygosporum]
MDSHTIDALPYFDKEYEDPATRKIVDELIAEEMKNNSANDSIKLPPPISLFRNNPLLRAEYDRQKKNIPMKKFDTERYKLNQPEGDLAGDTEEWINSINNARSQLEHQQNRIENLELLNKYGANAWKIHNSRLESILDQLNKDLDYTNEQILYINKARKYEQTEASIELGNLNNKWNSLIVQLADIKAAIAQLEEKNES